MLHCIAENGPVAQRQSVCLTRRMSEVRSLSGPSFLSSHTARRTTMTKAEAEKIIEAALAALPAAFRNKIDNLVITTLARPTAAQKRKFGAGLLGLYEGIPLSERGMNYSGAMPDKITLFYRSIEDSCDGPAAAARQLGHTLRHELAHHFGIDDARLRAKGNY